MLIDWPTTIAQIINFLILLFLLRRFLYRPLVDVIAARREGIAQEFAEAQRQTSRGEELQRLYNEKLAAWEHERVELLEVARAEADALREELLAQARRSVAAERAGWQENLSRDQEAFLGRLELVSREQILAITRQVLRDMADTDVETRMAAAFVRHLTTLDAATQRSVRESHRQENDRVTVGSAFELPHAARQKVEAALGELLRRDDLSISYDRSPDLIAGLQVQIGGHQLSWSLEDYLQSLENRLSEALVVDGGHGGGAA